MLAGSERLDPRVEAATKGVDLRRQVILQGLLPRALVALLPLLVLELRGEPPIRDHHLRNIVGRKRLDRPSLGTVYFELALEGRVNRLLVQNAVVPTRQSAHFQGKPIPLAIHRIHR